MAPCAAPSCTTCALFKSTPGLHAEIVPDSPAKMNGLGPLALFALSTKLLPPLKTSPVGLPGPAVPAGIATTSDCATPLPSYSVEVDVPLSATQTKPCGLNATPQALTRCASVFETLYGLPALLTSVTSAVAT